VLRLVVEGADETVLRTAGDADEPTKLLPRQRHDLDT
jgi:hypothetical protein